MKKLTLLCTCASREATLDALRDLGVVHLQHVQLPEGVDLDEARNLVDHLKRALEVLPKHPHVKPSGKTPHEVVKSVWELIHRKQELTEQVEALEMDIRHVEPYGSFSPEMVRELAEQGVTVKLCKLPFKEMPELPDNVKLAELSRDRSSVYAALIVHGELDLAVEEIPLPKQSLDAMKKHLEELRVALVQTDEEFSGFAGDHAAVAELAGDAEDRVKYLEARTGMGDTADVWYLRGFFPAAKEVSLRTMAVEQGWAALVETPSAEDDVPTLLRNPKWVSPIKAVFDMIGVIPGYKELDISALFLIFLSIFFAFLIGDAGYGLLFIGLTLFGKFKTKGNAAAQPALNLLLLMSACCVIFGVLTGNYFGIILESLPAPLSGLSSNYLTGKTAEGWNSDLAANHVMFVCFAIGTLHLTLAHGWNLIRKINSWAALADLGWLCSTWALFSVVLQMVLYMELPAWITVVQMPLLGTGIVLIIASLLLTKSYFGLVTLALDVINNFVDIISYVRLYAVGAASIAIAQAFNGMAMDIGFGGIAALGAAFILFVGHALNIVLGAMGVMVHGIRLNTLEFSGHAGVEWAGTHFNPFKKKSETL
jgi:V/A-type H+-transporting ATPase subunit I